MQRNKLIYKQAKSKKGTGSQLIIEDATDALWENSSGRYNKLVFKLIEYDGSNNTTKRIPVFLDVGEIRAIFKQISLGRFETVYGKDYKIYGGARGNSNAKSVKRENGKLVPIISEPLEAKIFTINKNKNYYNFQMEVSVGRSGNNGTIEFTGAKKEYLRLGFSEQEILPLIEETLCYLQAKQNSIIGEYFTPIDSSEKQRIDNLYKEVQQMSNSTPPLENLVEQKVGVDYKRAGKAEAKEILRYLYAVRQNLKKKA
ncbi:MAG: hypothetical protein ACOCQR_02615 [bacterium]